MKTISTEAKNYCLQLEFLNQRVLTSPIELAAGLNEVGEYLHGEGLLGDPWETGDVIKTIRDINEENFARIAKKYKPDYKGCARLSLVDLSEKGGALRSHAVSELYQL